jgi:hypothetical protein
MTANYVIGWNNPQTRKGGNGTTRFTLEVAQKICEESDKLYPPLQHPPIRIPPPDIA